MLRASRTRGSRACFFEALALALAQACVASPPVGVATWPCTLPRHVPCRALSLARTPSLPAAPRQQTLALPDDVGRADGTAAGLLGLPRRPHGSIPTNKQAGHIVMQVVAVHKPRTGMLKALENARCWRCPVATADTIVHTINAYSGVGRPPPVYQPRSITYLSA